MVTRSPLSACVESSASEDGARRSGASASEISNSSPATKRAALTLPSRYFAARSALAGVSRGSSSIAVAQQAIDRTRGLALAALGAPRFGGRRPSIDIDMQPAPGRFDEALEKQSAGDRACKAAGRRIVDVGDLRLEPAVVWRPQRQPPQRIMLLPCASRKRFGERFVVGIKRRQ